MKRLLSSLVAAGSSRAVPPVVIGLFFLIYIIIAFFTDETLITLMAFTRKSFVLAALLALIPLNCIFRMAWETRRGRARRRALAGIDSESVSDLFDETVSLPGAADPDSGHHTLAPGVAGLETRLASVGYKVCRTEKTIAAWRGLSAYPARLLFLVGTFCLFSGILISITTRAAYRQMVIEGVPMPTPSGTGGLVERIALAKSTGSILSRVLTMEVVGRNGTKTFGLYPPSMYDGAFVYPRYLGVAAHIIFAAPDMKTEYETYSNLNCYPPGKEDSVLIAGSPYKIIFSIPEPTAGSDRYISYMSGVTMVNFKLLKGPDLLFAGSARQGGEFVRDGYRLALPDIKRLVVTDFIKDYGVLFIWVSALFFTAAVFVWLPIRIFFPRCEILFRLDPHATKAYSRTEGRLRMHAGVFYEALDVLAVRKTDIPDG